MACLTKEKGNVYRIHWKFQVRVGPRTGETVEGSLQLGRCTRAAARARLREIETWEEAVKTGRHLPDTSWDEVFGTWVRERELTYTPQSLARAKRVVSLYRRWREAKDLPCKTVEQVANRQDLTAWRDHRLDHEAGRKTVANDFATLSALFGWCAREKYLPDNPIDRIARPRFVTKKEGTPLTRQQAGSWLWSIQPQPGRGARGPLTWTAELLEYVWDHGLPVADVGLYSKKEVDAAVAALKAYKPKKQDQKKADKGAALPGAGCRDIALHERFRDVVLPFEQPGYRDACGGVRFAVRMRS